MSIFRFNGHNKITNLQKLILSMFIFLAALILSEYSFASAPPVASGEFIFLKCRGNINHQQKLILGFADQREIKRFSVQGEMFKVTRVESSLNNKGYVVTGRHGKKFVKYIGRYHSQYIDTKMLVGYHQSKPSKDIITSRWPIRCRL